MLSGLPTAMLAVARVIEPGPKLPRRFESWGVVSGALGMDSLRPIWQQVGAASSHAGTWVVERPPLVRH